MAELSFRRKVLCAFLFALCFLAPVYAQEVIVVDLEPPRKSEEQKRASGERTGERTGERAGDRSSDVEKRRVNDYIERIVSEERARLERELAELSEEVNRLRQERRAAEERISEMSAKLSEAQSRLDAVSAESASCSARRSELEKALQSAAERAEELEKKRKELESALEEKIKEFERRIEALRREQEQRQAMQSGVGKAVVAEAAEIIARSLGVKDAYLYEVVRRVPAETRDVSQIRSIIESQIAKNPFLLSGSQLCDEDFRSEVVGLESIGEMSLATFIELVREKVPINIVMTDRARSATVFVKFRSSWAQVLKNALRLNGLRLYCKNDLAMIGTEEEISRVKGTVELSYDARKDLSQQVRQQSGVRSAVFAEGRLYVTVDEDKASEVDRFIRQLLARQRRVVIEGKVISVKRDKADAFAGVFAALLDSGRGTVGVQSSSFSQSQSDQRSSQQQQNQAFQPESRYSMPSGSGFLGSIVRVGSGAFSLALGRVITAGFADVRNYPQVVVQDGETADLQIGRNFFIPLAFQGPQGATVAQVQTVQAGNSLRARPLISSAGVQLELEIESNDVDSSVVVAGIPAVNRRSLRTTVEIRPDEVIVVGGFSSDGRQGSERRDAFWTRLFPFLKSKSGVSISEVVFFALEVKVIDER